MAKKQREEPSGDSWMNTYSDLVTLLMTFFVLLFSMSSVDAEKWELLVDALAGDKNQVVIDPDGTSGSETIAGNQGEQSGEMSVTGNPEDLEEFDDLFAFLQKYVEENNLTESIEVMKDGSSVVYIRFRNNIFFMPDKADLRPEALEILRQKRKGGYSVVKMDPDYEPAPIERRSIYGITFEQGYNDLAIDESMLQNIVTQNKDLPQQARHDMLLALITLKYTQSNSVCYVKDGQTLGVGAGQQSRIHCTRLAGNKADTWWLRQHPKVLGLPFVDGIRRPDRDNAIDIYISDEHDDVLAEGVWQNTFKARPEALTAAEKKEWIAKQSGVTVGSDAFFPFGDNVERAFKSGVKYIVQPGGSIRDDHVISTADKHGMVMAFTGTRLFHH